MVYNKVTKQYKTMEVIKMNKLSEVIEQATQECIRTGSGEMELNNNISVGATWESWEENDSFDTIGIYIYENGVIKFYYQLKEILIESY